MFQQFAFDAPSSRQSFAYRVALISMFIRDTTNGLVATLRQILLALGLLSAIGIISFLYKPELISHFKNLVPFADSQETLAETIVAPNLTTLMATSQQTATSDSVPTNNNAVFLGNQREQKSITNWLARRYHVAPDATNMLVSASYLTGKEVQLDPLLILAVMAIESGLNPFAESPVGAQGLMQVMSKIHQDKFQEMGGVKAALNPVANIKVGALILKDYVTRGGSMEAGLKLYVGAGSFETDGGYGSRVLIEYRRLKDVAMGKNVPTSYAPVYTAPAINMVKPDTTIESKVDPEATKDIVKEQVASL